MRRSMVRSRKNFGHSRSIMGKCERLGRDDLEAGSTLVCLDVERCWCLLDELVI